MQKEQPFIVLLARFLFPIALMFFVYYHISEFIKARETVENKRLEYIGSNFVLNHDTLTILNYKDNQFTLSNDVVVHETLVMGLETDLHAVENDSANIAESKKDKANRFIINEKVDNRLKYIVSIVVIGLLISLAIKLFFFSKGFN